jgi:hypothetical protein
LKISTSMPQFLCTPQVWPTPPSIIYCLHIHSCRFVFMYNRHTITLTILTTWFGDNRLATWMFACLIHDETLTCWFLGLVAQFTYTCWLVWSDVHNLHYTCWFAHIGLYMLVCTHKLVHVSLHRLFFTSWFV